MQWNEDWEILEQVLIITSNEESRLNPLEQCRRASRSDPSADPNPAQVVNRDDLAKAVLVLVIADQ
jgi:hypothetical protein